MNLPKNRTPLTLWSASLLVLATLAPLYAQITVDSTTSWATRTTNQPMAFDASGSDKLVVVATAEHGFNNTSGIVNGITYNGEPLTAAVERLPVANGTDITYHSVWYLDDPGLIPGAGEIQVAAVNREIVTVLALSGTDPGVGATVIGSYPALSADLTTTATDSLVVASLGMGGDGNTGNTDNTDAVDPPLTEIAAPKDPSNWLGHVTGTAQVPTAGAGTYGFATDQTGGYHVIAVEFLRDTSGPDVTPPTLTSTDIVDDQEGGPIFDTDTVTYTVTFSEAMDAGSIGVDDFEDAGTSAATVDSVSGGGGTFSVAVTPGGMGTLQLQVKAGAVLSDQAGNLLDTAAPIADDTIITVESDVTAPILASTDIVDDQGGGPIFQTQSVTYTVTFSEPMDDATVQASAFEDGGTSAATIDSVSGTGAVYTVTVSPTGTGTLQLQVKAGAVLTDIAGNVLDTTSPIADDTVIAVQTQSTEARAQPTVLSSTSWALRNEPDTMVFDASAADKLVVVATAEHGFNNTNGTVNGITYNGEPLTVAVERMPVENGADITYHSIWYLDNPGSFAGAGTIDVDAVNREIVTAIALSDTDEGHGATAVGAYPGLSVDLSTSSNNSIVIASLAMGGNGNTGNTDNTDTVAPLTEIAAPKDPSNWLGHVTGAQEVANAGNGTFGFTTNQNGGHHAIAVEFQGGTAGPSFVITEIIYSPVTDEVTLTWRSRPDTTYAAKYSTDMTDWGADLDDGITSANDEVLDDGDQITMTFDLGLAGIAAEKDLFFRIEERVDVE